MGAHFQTECGKTARAMPQNGFSGVLRYSPVHLPDLPDPPETELGRTEQIMEDDGS